MQGTQPDPFLTSLIGHCSCGHLLRSPREQEQKVCLECRIAVALQVMPLSVPVPPTLEECCGYTGEARLVALFWGGGDECWFDDGRSGGTGEWDGFLTFVEHERVWGALRGFNLGSSEEPATHWLLLDRQSRQICIATATAARQLLQQQWGKPDEETVLVVDLEEWERLVQDLNARLYTIEQKDILALMQQQQTRVEEMRTWLDGVPSTISLPKRSLARFPDLPPASPPIGEVPGYPQAKA
jgi:hypothetical protein